MACGWTPWVATLSVTREIGSRFELSLWHPLRSHGEPSLGRTVSFFELFDDLAYMAVIAEAACRLAEQVSVRESVEFAIFALNWIAWLPDCCAPAHADSWTVAMIGGSTSSGSDMSSK